MAEIKESDLEMIVDLDLALNASMHGAICEPLLNSIYECSQTAHEWLNFAALHSDFESASWIEKHAQLGRMQDQIKLLMPIVTRYDDGNETLLDQPQVDTPLRSTGIFKNAFSDGFNDPDFEMIEADIFSELKKRQVDALAAFVDDVCELLDQFEPLEQQVKAGKVNQLHYSHLLQEKIRLIIFQRLAAPCMRIISKATGFFKDRIILIDEKSNSRKERNISNIVAEIKAHQGDKSLFSKRTGKPNKVFIEKMIETKVVDITTKRGFFNLLKEIYEEKKLVKKQTFS